MKNLKKLNKQTTPPPKATVEKKPDNLLNNLLMDLYERLQEIPLPTQPIITLSQGKA